MTVVWFIVLIASLYFLSKAADYFTDAAEDLGTILKLPHFVVGVLIVAVGTSLPELATSIFGIARGEAGILAGNVTGSTIANVLIGLGLVVVISGKTAKFNWDSVSNDMPFLVITSILLALTITDGIFNLFEAILFILSYIVYVIYSLQIRKMNTKGSQQDFEKEVRSHIRQRQKEEGQKPAQTKKEKERKILKTVLIFIISLGFIILAANYTVDSLIELAKIFGFGTEALAASLVAIGTSLPEISVGISSAKKGNFDLVIGNIMGSNIFNILVVFGIIGLFTPISIPHQVISFILPVMGGVILIQWLVTMDKKLTITEGLMMTLLYIAFVGKLFNII